MWLLILLVTVTVVIYLRIRNSMNYWKDRNVPFIKPVPLLGNAWPLILRKKSFMDHIKGLYNAYPDKRFIGTFSFMKPQILVRDPELIKQLVVKDFDHFTDRVSPVSEDTEPLFAKNLLGLKGQKWRDMRATLSPSFTSSKMKFLFEIIYQCAEQFTKHIEKSSKDVMNEEMKDLFSRYTNDAIATAAFGISVDSLKSKENEFFSMGKCLTTFTGGRVFKFFGYLIFPALMRLLKITIFPASVTIFFGRVIKETIRAREEQGIIRPDMIHLLLEAKKGRAKEDEKLTTDEGFAAVDEELPNTKGDKNIKSHLTDEDITAQAVLFFFAGFDTSSNLMSFLAYELATKRDVQTKLQEEIDKVMDKNNAKISYEVVLTMKYLDMVVSEALRKWTPGIATDRVCVKDYEMPVKQPDEVPFVIKKGTSIMIPTCGIHYDPHYYPNPENFDPERFSDENKNSIQPFTYMPFGVGPRNCIASRFALMEIKILFSLLLSKVDIVTTDKTQIPLILDGKGFSMIPKSGIWLGFKQRNKKN